MRKSEKTKVAVVAAKAPDVFVVPAPVPAASAQNRGSQGPTKGLSKSSSLDTSSMRAPSTPGKTLHSSAKTMEVPAELLAVPKSPRGMTVSVAEAQLMKSPKFVAQQLTREASEWLEYDRAFEGQGKHGLEEYEMLEPLGQGRFGAVRKCRERKTGETYAIKAISRDQSDDMATCIQHALVERRILSSLSHPYVCGFKCAFQDAEKVYFVLEYLSGGDLMRMIQDTQGKGLRRDEVVFYSAEIVLALAYLHSRHVVYNLKPENVLIDGARHAKLSDFGLSKITANKTYSLTGTPQFLAPEMVASSRPLMGYDHAVDWWGMGVMMHEMASAQLPFDDANWMLLQQKILTVQPVFPPAIDNELSAVLLGLLTKDPKKRFTAAELRQQPFYSSLSWDKLSRRELAPPAK